MKIDRIEIKIKSKRHFADVALLVDKPNFIEWVIELRKKWKITPELFNADYHTFYSHIWSQGNSKAWENFNKDIERIRSTYQRLPNFDKVIFYAIACNEVTDGIYSTCYLDTIADPNNPNDETLYKYAIIVTPNTTVPDVRKVLADFRKKMKIALQQENDPVLKQQAASEYKYEFGPRYTPSPRNIDNIMRDRKWYWQSREGLKNKEIAQRAKDEDKITITEKGVFEAVKSYKLKLQKI